MSSITAAGWLQSVFGLPSFFITSRKGSVTDLVVTTLGIALFIAYLYAVPKLLRIDYIEFGQMLKGK